MERGFNACQTHRSMYPSIFKRFPVIQPVNLTRRMAIANGTCVSYWNQPKAHYLATSRKSRWFVVAVNAYKHLAIRRESKVHFGFPWVRPGIIAINFTWMETEFNACQTHRSMYPSIFNLFPVIGPESSKVRHFSTFLHILASPWYAPGTIAVNITWIERIQCLSNALQHVGLPIYLQPFPSNWTQKFKSSPF